MKGSEILIIRVSIVLVVVAIWEGISHSGLFYDEVFPSIVEILSELIVLLSDADFYRHIFVTLFEIILGLTLAIVFGGISGVLIGSNYATSK